MTFIDRARGLLDRTLAGARPYRFEGEQENHADLLRERRVSLSMMAGADPADPDQVRMASEIEHDAEARLEVLLGKPKLTLEEKRERDDIQRGLQARRQSFDGDAPVLVPREGETRPNRFLGAVAGIQLWHALALGWAVTFGLLGVQTARVASLKADVRELNADVAMGERNLAAARTERDLLADAVVAADENAQQTARNVEEERRLRARAEEQLRRARRAAAQARSDGPIDYGFGGVRNDQPPTPGTDSGAGSGTGNSR